jgi:DNA-binding MarR family transcriptional regulator
MTTPTTATAQPVTGQDINLAAQAVGRLRDGLLAEAGTSFPTSAALNTIVTRGPSVPRESLMRELGSGLDVDASTVQVLLRALQARGLIRQTRPAGEGTAVHIELTPDGEAEHRRLGAIVGAAVAELYGGIDADDLATTRRVLVTVTERVSAQLRLSAD